MKPSNELQLLWQNNKIIFIIFVILIFVIPSGTYIVSWRIKANTSPETQNYNRTVTFESTSSGKSKNSLLDKTSTGSQSSKTESVSTPTTPSGGAQISFGPTMDFLINIEGRPSSDYSAKTFVGIAEGKPTTKPQYLLSFTVDVPVSGSFTGLSLAGLNQGSTYTAYLKTPAQIATASAFVVSPTISKLNAGQTLKLISGDLNEDNAINSADYSIAKAALGSSANASNWNANADFNLDGVVNNFDLQILRGNLGKIGLSGAWYSIPPTASGSATLAPPPDLTLINEEMAKSIGGSDLPTPPGGGGYWIWVPKVDF